MKRTHNYVKDEQNYDKMLAQIFLKMQEYIFMEGKHAKKGARDTSSKTQSVVSAMQGEMVKKFLKVKIGIDEEDLEAPPPKSDHREQEELEEEKA